MKSLNKQLNIMDAIKNMQQDFESLVINLTMNEEEKAEAIVKKAGNKARVARRQAQKMFTRMVGIKDLEDDRVTPLEAFEHDEERILAAGKRITAQMAAYLTETGNTENQAPYKALKTQQSQLSIRLQDHRGNPAYTSLKQAYVVALDAYQTALETATKAEASYLVVKDNLPMLIEAFETYKMAQKAKTEAEEAADDPFNAETFMADVSGEVANAQAELRSIDAVKRDLDAMKPVNPVDDILAQFDHEEANAEILAEFGA